MSQCTDSSNTCTSTGDSSKSQTDCGSSAAQSCCPIEKTVEMWSGAFCQAMTDVKADILKEKIKKAWGPQLDEVGDAVVEAMGIKWHAMLTQAKSQLDLRESIKKVFLSDLQS